MPEYQQPPDPHPDIEGQTSILQLICTRSEDCQADVDEHAEDCPVERKLRDYFGY